MGHRGVGKTALLARIAQYLGGAEASSAGHPSPHRGIGLSPDPSISSGQVSTEFVDLDLLIESKAGYSVREIFEQQGEPAFRALEAQTFQQLADRGPVVVAVGAGFDMQRLDSSWHVLWVRRPTDSLGRIFHSRPRLDSDLSPLEEYKQRFHARELRFRERADEVLWLEEGQVDWDHGECDFFRNEVSDLRASVTLLPENFRSPEQFRNWITRRLHWGWTWIELRDDLLTLDQMKLAARILPPEMILVSFRSDSDSSSSSRTMSTASTGTTPVSSTSYHHRLATENFVCRYNLAFDWDIKLGECGWAQPKILSCHLRKEGEPLSEFFSQLEAYRFPEAELKAAPRIDSFAEVLQGEKWRNQDRRLRSFLPCSQDGRWAWYRLLVGAGQPLNFLREGEGSSADQPTLLQWMHRRQIETIELKDIDKPGYIVGDKSVIPTEFAAVMGDPIVHSRTPVVHRPFAAKLSLPVVAIRLNQNEWDQGALEALRALGLKRAAVTSPLKNKAFEICRDVADGVGALGSVNTLRWSDQSGGWCGFNTDLAGFSSAIQEAAVRLCDSPCDLSSEAGLKKALGEVVVWGGGGTLPVIKRVCPGALFFSARRAENRTPAGLSGKDIKPQLVIWASGRRKDDREKASFPSKEWAWAPRLVLDLNYGEDSPGLEYALSMGCAYQSGDRMFWVQAKHQIQALYETSDQG